MIADTQCYPDMFVVTSKTNTGVHCMQAETFAFVTPTGEISYNAERDKV